MVEPMFRYPLLLMQLLVIVVVTVAPAGLAVVVVPAGWVVVVVPAASVAALENPWIVPKISRVNQRTSFLRGTWEERKHLEVSRLAGLGIDAGVLVVLERAMLVV